MKRALWITVLRHGTAGMMAWEFFAIELDKPWMPTFSTLAGKHRWLAPTLLIALAVHFVWPFPGQDEPSPLELVS